MKSKLNMNFDKLKINYSPFPYIEINDFISKNYSSKLRNEILSYDGFDDKVMVNRKRINKGSKNFEKIISNSDNINNIYEYKYYYISTFIWCLRYNWKYYIPYR